MINPYSEYYISQAGSGLTFFEGRPYQRGHGFFGDLWSHILKPLGRYIGKKVLTTGARIGTDVLEGENLLESAKTNLKRTGKNMLEDGITRATRFAQTGKGRKRRRIKKRRKSRPKSKRRQTKKKRVTKRKRRVKHKRKNKFENFLF